MTKSAQDLFRICVAFGGADPVALLSRVYLRRNGGAYINAATVERAMGELREHGEANV
jgi:hypothetical protein